MVLGLMGCLVRDPKRATNSIEVGLTRQPHLNLNRLTHPVLFQELDRLTVQRHLHLTPSSSLVHDNSLYMGMPSSTVPTRTDKLVPAQCFFLPRLYTALADYVPKIARINSIFEQK